MRWTLTVNAIHMPSRTRCLMRRAVATAGCAALITLLLTLAGWAATGSEWSALSEDQRATYLIGLLDQWKWTVSLFDAERAQKGGQPSPAEAWFRWVHQCLASRQMTFRQIGTLVVKRLGDNASERTNPMPMIVSAALVAACKE
jgi:hypothetical protein